MGKFWRILAAAFCRAVSQAEAEKLRGKLRDSRDEIAGLRAENAEQRAELVNLRELAEARDLQLEFFAAWQEKHLQAMKTEAVIDSTRRALALGHNQTE